jgi:hypothetical protein
MIMMDIANLAVRFKGHYRDAGRELQPKRIFHVLLTT